MIDFICRKADILEDKVATAHCRFDPFAGRWGLRSKKVNLTQWVVRYTRVMRDDSTKLFTFR